MSAVLDREQYIADFVTELTGYLKENIDQVEVTPSEHIIAFGEKCKRNIWNSVVYMM